MFVWKDENKEKEAGDGLFKTNKVKLIKWTGKPKKIHIWNFIVKSKLFGWNYLKKSINNKRGRLISQLNVTKLRIVSWLLNPINQIIEFCNSTTAAKEYCILIINQVLELHQNKSTVACQLTKLLSLTRITRKRNGEYRSSDYCGTSCNQAIA